MSAEPYPLDLPPAMFARSQADTHDDLQEQLAQTQAQVAQLQSQLNQMQQASCQGSSSLLLSSHLTEEPLLTDQGAATSIDPEEFSTLTEDFEKLSGEWSKFQKDEAKKKSDAAKKPTFQINGRIHLDSWSFLRESDGIGFFENPNPASPDFGNDPQDRFVFRRIRLEMKGDILETMLYRIQLDFNNPAEPEYKDVYLGFQELPFNQFFIIGNQKRPLGLDHLNSSRNNVFMERPLVVEAFNEDARRVGAAFYGHTDDDSLNWAYGMYTLENSANSGRIIGDSLQLSANARVSGTPWYDSYSDGRGYYHWGLAGMLARPDGDDGPADQNQNEGRFRTRDEARTDQRWLDTGRIAGAQWYEILALESMLNLGPFQLTGEYQTTWLQRDNTTTGTGPDVHFQGAYLYASYFLTGEHIPIDRQTGTIGRVKPFENFFLVDRCDGGCGHGWGAWQVAARFSYLDLTDADILGGVGYESSFAVNWHWTAYSKLQCNLSYSDIQDHRSVGGYTDGNAWILGTRLAIEF